MMNQQIRELSSLRGCERCWGQFPMSCKRLLPDELGLRRGTTVDKVINSLSLSLSFRTNSIDDGKFSNFGTSKALRLPLTRMSLLNFISFFIFILSDAIIDYYSRNNFHKQIVLRLNYVFPYESEYI